MSRLDRLRAGMTRASSRVAAFRDAAVREQERREREAEARVASDSGEPGGAEVGKGRAARARGATMTEQSAYERPSAEYATGTGRGQDTPPPAVLPPGDGGRPEPSTAIPWGVRVAAEAGWRLLVLAAVVWVLIQVVSAISLLVTAFASGLLITALLQPFVGRLKRWGVGRGAATAITAVSGFAVMGLIGWFVVWQVMENIDDLVHQVQEGIDELRNWVIDSGPLNVTEENLNELVDNLNEWINEHSAELTSAGLEGVNYLVQFFTGAGVALFVVLFLLYDGRGVWYWFLKFIPSAGREGVAGAGPRAWITLTGYVRGTVLVALIDALGIGLGLFILQVPMAIPLAVIVFLFAFVPIIGAIVSGALAVVVAFVTDGFFTAMLVFCVVLIVQQVESQILQPFILGRLVRVHPLGVVLAVTGGTLVAGIPGAVVAVPFVAVCNTVVGYLRAYQNEAEARVSPARGAGATIAPMAPERPASTEDVSGEPRSGPDVP